LTFDGEVVITGLLSYQNGIADQAGANGNAIRAIYSSTNGVVLHNNDHGGVRRSGDRSDGSR